MKGLATRAHARMYRLSGGRILGRMGGQRVLLLQTVGRRTGRTHTTPVQYLPRDGAFVVVAAAGGAARSPSWYLNLCAAPNAQVRIGAQDVDIRAREVRDTERDGLWRELTAANRYLARAARKAGHPLPVLKLAPTEVPAQNQNGSTPLAVVALGGNALLRRGEPASAANQLSAARAAAHALGPVSERARLVVTHGNGPQVGLLALKEDAYDDGDPYPLDVLDAESEGQIGYVVELELDNAIHHQDTVTVITRVLVDADDPAFGEPTKFIGPVYDEQRAKGLAAERGWVVKPDGDSWRRVVPSPDPKQIIQLGAIRSLVDAGLLVVCVGGGGVPVVAKGDGHEGVEAVIDKDLASALLAVGLGADVLVLATDVDAIYTDWGTERQRAVARTSPTWLRSQSFAGGSMGPKVEAVCRFVEATGKRAAVGRLEELPGLIEGVAGTQIRPDA